MDFKKWLIKKSDIGDTTRSIIKAYQEQKKGNRDISNVEIFRAITKRRYNIICNNIDPAIIGTAAQPKTLREYLKCIVIYERLPGSIDSEDIIREVIDEICNEAGI
jgi:hypothetical protein